MTKDAKPSPERTLAPNLPTNLKIAARLAAARRGTTVKALVTDAITRELALEDPEPAPADGWYRGDDGRYYYVSRRGRTFGLVPLSALPTDAKPY